MSGGKVQVPKFAVLNLASTKIMKQVNIKEDLLSHVGKKEILCAHIDYRDNEFYLPIDHTPEQFSEFSQGLDINITVSYEPLYGTIWYKDGSWSKLRSDPNELYQWWEHYSAPEIPKELAPFS